MATIDETESLVNSSYETSAEFHKMPIRDVFSQFGSSPEGLSSKQTKAIRNKVGLNSVPPPLSAPAWLCCLLPCLLRTKSMQEYNECVPEHAMVKRNSAWLKMDSASLVPGDVVMVEAGQRVPADMRVFEASDGCKFDTSAISGVSTRKECLPKQHDDDIFQSPNMAYLGYHCVEGNCKGIVIYTGNRTIISSMIVKKQWPPKPPSEK